MPTNYDAMYRSWDPNYQPMARTAPPMNRNHANVWTSRVLPIWGAAAGGAALSGLFGGAGAAGAAGAGGGSGAASAAAPAAAWSMPGVSAPVFGGAAGAATGGGAAGLGTAAGASSTLGTLGHLFSSPGMNLGVNAGLTVAGMVSGNRAARDARADQMAQYREGLALQRTQLEAEMRNADLDREDARALNAAVNELRRRELDAAEEERAYTRSVADRRDARLEPYRQTSEAALRSLQRMWGLG